MFLQEQNIVLGITEFTLNRISLVRVGLVWGHAVGFMANTVGLALPLAATGFHKLLFVDGLCVVVWWLWLGCW
ncbi:hypothetical protein [Gleimia europaea]|uniref:hypothetical protein n=1 Tax=Gleimia europaea TaxID=66228 RepID=UPI001E4DC766|nr:hypothetical protein [Gleimia europaea]